ncbi:MAG TPA: GAF domain-containing protein [Methylomirabilota bacterium]|nr:GAF domain-containing protein [Methylomirabilota bacterium]
MLLTLGTLIPVLAFGGLMLVAFNRQTRGATQRGLVETARALSVAVDQHVIASTSVLQALAVSEPLQAGDLKRFDRAARGVLATQPAWQSIVLYAPDGRQLINTVLPPGASLPVSSNPGIVVRVARTRQPIVSDLFTGSIRHRSLVLVLVPVVRNGEVEWVLGASFHPGALTELLSRQKLPPDAIGSLLDRNKVIIARTRAADRFVGQRGTPDLAAKMDETAEGAFRLLTKEGQSVYAAISRSERTGWTIALGVPQSAADAPLRRSLWLLVLVGGGSTLLGVVLAVLGARRIAGPIASLSTAAEVLMRGGRIEASRSTIEEVNAVTRAMENASEERRRHEVAAEALATVGRDLTGTLDLTQVTNRAVSAVLGLFGVRRAVLYQVNDVEDCLICVAVAGAPAPEKWLGGRLEKGEGVAGRVLAEGRPVSSADIASDPMVILPRWAHDQSRAEHYGAVTAVPLRARGRMLGVLALADRAGRAFTDEELRLLATLADQVAVALENARLYRESELRRGAAEGLTEVGRLLPNSLDAQVVSQRIVDNLRALLSAYAAAIYRLDPESEDLVALAISGAAVAVDSIRGAVVPAGIGAAGVAVRDRQGLVTADVLDDPRILLTPEFRAQVEAGGFRAVLAVPLMVQGRVIGALGVGDRPGRVFAVEDIRIAQAFADQAAIAIENARLHKETAERLARSETLLSVGSQVSGILDVTEMMRRVARETCHALGADMVGAFLADADHAFLQPIAGYHVPKHLLTEFMAAPLALKGHPVLEEAWAKREAVAAVDLAGDPRVDPEALRRFPQRSALFCPMVVQGQPIGGLFATWFEQEHQFTPAELRLVEGISRQAGIALANARLVDELKTRQSRLEGLLRVGRELSRIQPVESLLAGIAQTSGQLFDANAVTFHLVQGDELVLSGSWGEQRDVLASPRLKIGESLTGSVVQTGDLVLVEDPAADPRLAPSYRESYRKHGVRAFLGVPVKLDDQVIGVLAARTCRSEGFSQADAELARALASQAAIALENSRLYQEVRRAFNELSQTKDQLVQAQKMEAVGQLAGGIAHDFNNILTVIGGRSHLLLARAPADDPARPDIELIGKASDRAAALTRQLLAFSRKQVLEPKVLDLNALVGGLAPMLRRLIGEHIDLLIVPGAGLEQVLADPGQLEQVVMNLAVNAREAMPEGGMLKIETAVVELPDGGHHHAQGHVPPGRYVTLAVQDSGCGMDSTTLGKIFEPFFTTKEAGKGTGLGLSTVYGIVHQSAGFIGVDSRVGQGTAFTIYLPPTARASETPEAGPSAASPARGRETILLVEDDEGTRGLISDVLKAYDYTILETGDPLEAILIGERHPGPIHLLFTDVVMPALRGPALAAELRSRRPEIRLLYMSGYTDGTIVSRDTIDPPGSFLQKPFMPDVLARAVRDVLDAILERPGRAVEHAHD